MKKNTENTGLLLLSALLLTAFSTVSASEIGNGTRLFDGKTLEGWKEIPGGKWEVRDGAIVGTSPKGDPRHGIIYFDQPYSDFKIEFEYKSLKGNSGFYFRSEKVGDHLGFHGIQAEIDAQGQCAGGLYETAGRNWLIRPSREIIRKAFKRGQWNKMEVVAVGETIEVTLNGVRTASLKDRTGRKSGLIGFQLHGGLEMHVEVRNIVMTDLSKAKRDKKCSSTEERSSSLRQ